MDVEGHEALPGDGDRIPVAEMHDVNRLPDVTPPISIGSAA
jgi:hypothetical protein